jgi:transposase
MPRSAPAVSLSIGDQNEIQGWLVAHGTPQQVALRSRIVLGAAEGRSDSAIARQLQVNRHTVILWRQRFLEEGKESLWEVAAGRGRKPTYGPEKIQAVLDATLQTKPKGMTQWSCRRMAESQGLSKSTVSNIWRSHNLKPHRVKTFKLSRDPKFLEKLTDVVGLYLNPPEKALVLCVDEKSQIQALDRTQPGLPMKKGRCGTMTHDYKRNGTTTLFAAMDTLKGNVLSRCMPRHRHQEFIRFLNQIDQQTPADLAIHLILDNYGTHKHAKVQRWLKQHRRFHFHFIPTSSSWPNVVERFFRDLTTDRIRRDSFTSVPHLIAAIHYYIDAHNEDPQPFIWTAEAEKILEKVGRARTALISQQQRGSLH